MKRSFWITLAISAVACGIVLFVQEQLNGRLALRVAEQKMPPTDIDWSRLMSARDQSQTGSPLGTVSPDGTVEEERVASALEGVERISAELGYSGASLGAQIEALAAAMASGTPMEPEEKFETRVPELLRLVENLNRDELFALVERTPDSQAKMFLERLAAEQDPSRALSAGVTDVYGLDALSRIDPGAALQRLKGSLEDEEGVLKGNKTRLSRYAVLMMQDDVEAGLRELMWIRKIEDTDSMATTRFGRASLEGVDTEQLIEAIDDPEFTEIRGTIISMTLGHQLIESGIAAAAQQAQSMPLTPEELTGYMNGLIQGDIMAAEPEAMLGWIADAQPEENQLEMVPGAFLEWAKTDAVPARDWLSEQEPSPLRDKTVANFASNAPNLERQSAAQWALEINDERTRTNTLRGVVRKWRKEDATAANAWLAENGLSL